MTPELDLTLWGTKKSLASAGYRNTILRQDQAVSPKMETCGTAQTKLNIHLHFVLWLRMRAIRNYKHLHANLTCSNYAHGHGL